MLQRQTYIFTASWRRWRRHFVQGRWVGHCSISMTRPVLEPVIVSATEWWSVWMQHSIWSSPQHELLNHELVSPDPCQYFSLKQTISEFALCELYVLFEYKVTNYQAQVGLSLGGGGCWEVTRPPQAAESKRWQNGYFNFFFILCAQQISNDWAA